MKTSEAGLAHIISFEGERLKAYRCSANVLTIGVGHTSAAGIPKVIEGMTITKAESNKIFRRDIVKFESGVCELISPDIFLERHQFDVLVSFAFNCGLSALGKSTLLKRVNAGRLDAVPAELMKWTKAGGKEIAGLVRRRRAEAKMWRGIGAQDVVSVDESRAEPDAPKPHVSVAQGREAKATVAAGGLGGVAVISELIPMLKDGRDVLQSTSPTVIIVLALLLALGAVWYFRKSRLEEE